MRIFSSLSSISVLELVKAVPLPLCLQVVSEMPTCFPRNFACSKHTAHLLPKEFCLLQMCCTLASRGALLFASLLHSCFLRNFACCE